MVQKYNIKIYDVNWNPLGRIYQPAIFDITYTHTLNEPGSMSLSILASNKWATSTILQKLHKIELLLGDEVIWNGFMMPTFGENVHTIECVGLLGLFDLDFMSRLIYSYSTDPGIIDNYADGIAKQIFALSVEDKQGIDYGKIYLKNPPKMKEEIKYIKISEGLQKV